MGGGGGGCEAQPLKPKLKKNTKFFRYYGYQKFHVIYPSAEIIPEIG
jgi:hypothetical protein